jgi:Uma2 family endonuclease
MGSVLTLPRSRPLTRADLDALPDDGHRYELIDAVLIVTPAPSMPHQRVVTRLLRLLDAACPDDLEVFVAPFDVALATDIVMQPDVLVARKVDLTPTRPPHRAGPRGGGPLAQHPPRRPDAQALPVRSSRLRVVLGR